MTHQREFNVHEKMIIIIMSTVDCRFLTDLRHWTSEKCPQ